MPELPEVETIVRALRNGGRDGPSIIGCTIRQADIYWPRSLVEGTPLEVSTRLAGQQILAVDRRAKWLVFTLSRDALLIHLRMSGDLRVEALDVPLKAHDRFVLIFENDTRMLFNDTRKFGRIWLTDDPQSALRHLGPEPLAADFTPEEFYERIHSRHRQIKPLLLDQAFLAGLGNIYTDEALHHAGIHPLRRSESLSGAETTRLLTAIRAVLQTGIQRNGASIDWVYRGGDFQNDFFVYGRTGEACKTCGQPVQRLVVGQRGTHFCPHCQPLEAEVNNLGEEGLSQ